MINIYSFVKSYDLTIQFTILTTLILEIRYTYCTFLILYLLFVYLVDSRIKRKRIMIFIFILVKPSHVLILVKKEERSCLKKKNF
jgi:hypothetical protein